MYVLDILQVLLQPYSIEEVKYDLFQMQPMKVPPDFDGLSLVFFQKYWHIVGDLMATIVFTFLNHGIIPFELNETFIIFISKKIKLKKIENFWLINLCNVAYKINAKIIANMLKVISSS